MQFMQNIHNNDDCHLPEPIPQVITTNKKNIVVYNISDLHADSEINKNWVITKCSPKCNDTNVTATPSTSATTTTSATSTSTSTSSAACTVTVTDEDHQDNYNILIIPGDIGSNITRIELIFKHLISQYDLVLYIIGILITLYFHIYVSIYHCITIYLTF